MKLKKLVRKAVKNFAPYVAGRNLESVKKEYRLKSVIKLASNENPIGAGRAAAEAVRKAAGGIFRYPDSDSSALRTAAGKKLGSAPENIVAGAGSDELIEIIAKTYFNPGDEIVVSKHAFIRYKMAAELMSARAVETPTAGLGHDLEAMSRAVTARTKAVFIANPNNPTGTYNTTLEMERFLKNLARRKVAPLIVIDEAYFEYAREFPDYPDSSRYIAHYPNVVALRTFSKIHGLAGLRLGLAICSKEVASELNRVRPPFNVSTVAQAAGIAALSDDKHVASSLAALKSGRDYIYRELKNAGIEFVRTAGNFILVKARGGSGADIFRKMLAKGVIVRAMDEYGLPGHFRVTVGLPSENKVFIEELKKITKKESAGRANAKGGRGRA
jgi:histidinol-phosphate aminotransferase